MQEEHSRSVGLASPPGDVDMKAGEDEGLDKNVLPSVEQQVENGEVQDSFNASATDRLLTTTTSRNLPRFLPVVFQNRPKAADDKPSSDSGSENEDEDKQPKEDSDYATDDENSVLERTLTEEEAISAEGELRCMPELVEVCEFLFLFRKHLKLKCQVNFNTLLDALVRSPGPGLLADLHFELLKAMTSSKSLSLTTWQHYLALKLQFGWQPLSKSYHPPPFKAEKHREAKAYAALPAKDRLLALKSLIDLRLERDDLRWAVEDSISAAAVAESKPGSRKGSATNLQAMAEKGRKGSKGDDDEPQLDAHQLRRKELGVDAVGNTYWWYDWTEFRVEGGVDHGHLLARQGPCQQIAQDTEPVTASNKAGSNKAVKPKKPAPPPLEPTITRYGRVSCHAPPPSKPKPKVTKKTDGDKSKADTKKASKEDSKLKEKKSKKKSVKEQKESESDKDSDEDMEGAHVKQEQKVEIDTSAQGSQGVAAGKADVKQEQAEAGNADSRPDSKEADDDGMEDIKKESHKGGQETDETTPGKSKGGKGKSTAKQKGNTSKKDDSSQHDDSSDPSSSDDDDDRGGKASKTNKKTKSPAKKQTGSEGDKDATTSSASKKRGAAGKDKDKEDTKDSKPKAPAAKRRKKSKYQVPPYPAPGSWEVVACSMDELEVFGAELAGSKKDADKRLHEQVLALVSELRWRLEEQEKWRHAKERSRKRLGGMSLKLPSDVNPYTSGRSQRQRKVVNYADDEYDKVMSTAIRLASRGDEPELPPPISRRARAAATAAATNDGDNKSVYELGRRGRSRGNTDDLIALDISAPRRPPRQTKQHQPQTDEPEQDTGAHAMDVDVHTGSPSSSASGEDIEESAQQPEVNALPEPAQNGGQAHASVGSPGTQAEFMQVQDADMAVSDEAVHILADGLPS